MNARTLEILRQAGFDMDEIASIAQDPRDAGHVNFVTRLNGQLIGRLPFERQGDEILAVTPHPLRNISQHRLEPLMARVVGEMPGVDLRYDHEWVSATLTDNGVVSVVRNLRTGESLALPALPASVVQIYESGGLAPMIGRRLALATVRKWCMFSWGWAL